MAVLVAQREKQRKLITVFVLVVATSFSVLYFGFFRQEERIPGLTPSEVTISKDIAEVKLDLDLLKEDRFLDLTPYSKLEGGVETGRKNPFAPYVE